MNERVAVNKRIADRLLDQGKLRESDYLRVVEFAKRKGKRVEEALLELDMIDEASLLKFVATLHKTQFVSTSRLSRARIDRAALAAVPLNMARHYALYPLVLDRKNDKLIVATADPDNAVAANELQMALQVQNVMMMVARPAAIVAAIARGYQGDKTLFRKLLAKREVDVGNMPMMRDPFLEQGARRKRKPERETGRPEEGEYQPPRGVPGETDLPPEPLQKAVDADARKTSPRIADSALDVVQAAAAHSPVGPAWQVPDDPAAQPQLADADADEVEDTARVPGVAHAQDEADDDFDDLPPPPTEVDALTGGPAGETDAIGAAADVGRRGVVPPPPSELRGAVHEPRVTQLTARRALSLPRSTLGLAVALASAVEEDPSAISTTGPFVEVVRVLVGLLEADREDLHGHSARVARLSHDLCERLGLSERETCEVVLAAYLHDVGKMSEHHLTALAVSQYDTHRELAGRVYAVGAELLQNVGLGAGLIETVTSMYEQVGGGGFPRGLVGDAIPVGGRVLAIADSYADLTHNPNNPCARLLSPDEALAVLRKRAGNVFDANLLDLLARALGGEKILTELLAARHRLLLIDPAPEASAVLQLRLAEQGFDVKLARTASAARAQACERSFTVVISEVDLQEPEEGLLLREELRSTMPDTVWVMLTARSGRETAERAFELGVDDFMSKPVSTEILVAKLRQLIARRAPAARGVAGSLAEMSLSDVVQIVSHGAKTCSLHLDFGTQHGEVHFRRGAICDAFFGGHRGEEAFYALLAMGDEGSFRIHPETAAEEEPSIEASTQALLLEGLRRLDEAAHRRG